MHSPKSLAMNSPRAKDQVPFEEWDLEFSIKPSTHLPYKVLDCKALPKKVLYRFFVVLTTQTFAITNSSHICSFTCL